MVGVILPKKIRHWIWLWFDPQNKKRDYQRNTFDLIDLLELRGWNMENIYLALLFLCGRNTFAKLKPKKTDNL